MVAGDAAGAYSLPHDEHGSLTHTWERPPGRLEDSVRPDAMTAAVTAGTAAWRRLGLARVATHLKARLLRLAGISPRRLERSRRRRESSAREGQGRTARRRFAVARVVCVKHAVPVFSRSGELIETVADWERLASTKGNWAPGYSARELAMLWLNGEAPAAVCSALEPHCLAFG